MRDFSADTPPYRLFTDFLFQCLGVEISLRLYFALGGELESPIDLLNEMGFRSSDSEPPRSSEFRGKGKLDVHFRFQIEE